MESDDKLDRDCAVDRRMDDRLIVNAPAEVTNLRGPDDYATECVIIEDVSDVGCRFCLHGPVQEGDMVAIQLLDRDGTRILELPIKFFEVKWVTRGIEVSVVGTRIVRGERLVACREAMKNRASLNAHK